MPAELDNLDPEMDTEMDTEVELDAEPEMIEPESDVIGTHGSTDREGAMAKADLFKLANYSHKLYQKLQDDDQLEAWVQAKITKAADYLASVYHYLEYEMKFSEYGHHLDNSDTLSEGQRIKIKELLSEAKDKMKDLKKSQAEKAKAKKVEEGALRGGERACTECGGSGMVYEEPKSIPDAVKGKVEKYNRQAKAFHAASKRLDRNKNGIPDDEEMEENLIPVPNPAGAGSAEKAKELGAKYPQQSAKEGFEADAKVGSTKKTATGELTKTDTGVKHKNTSYKDDGDELDSIAKSGKGVKSHAKAQSAAEKKDRAPAQKQSPKSAKTWGMKDGEKFDNRDGAPAKPKKEKEVDETYGQGVYEAKKKGDGNLANNAKPYDKVTRGDVIAGRLGKDEKGGKTVKEAAKQTMSRAAKGHEKYGKEGMAALAKAGKEGKNLDKVRDKYNKYDESVDSGKKKCPPMSHIKKMCQDGKSVAEICKMHSDCDQKELKQMIADCKKKMDEGKKAAAMWNNIRETQAYMAEKKSAVKKIKDVETDEGNEFSGELKKARDEHKDSFKVDGKTFPVKESTDFSRLQELTGRLNRAEKPMIAESREVDEIRALTKRLLG